MRVSVGGMAPRRDQSNNPPHCPSGFAICAARPIRPRTSSGSEAARLTCGFAAFRLRYRPGIASFRVGPEKTHQRPRLARRGPSWLRSRPPRYRSGLLRRTRQDILGGNTRTLDGRHRQDASAGARRLHGRPQRRVAPLRVALVRYCHGARRFDTGCSRRGAPHSRRCRTIRAARTQQNARLPRRDAPK